MSTHPTGRLSQRPDGLYLMVDRLFNAPIEDVWFTLTRPAELEKWIGTYTGSPSTGAVKFLMSAEEDAQWEYVSILECSAPHRFACDVGTGDDAWRLLVHLVEGDHMTTLTLGQRLRSKDEVATVGPGWDYYLDRMIAARAGQPLPEWQHYYPAHAQYYKELEMPSPSH
ncbi:SRPBCC domain-containing protein [Glaciibacter psychrotolerans]|uniref:Uncharacterized protein YndB with AHSA1/START domain n=1 Tax=Glaciibacter psychrotolerans TaxID=670054 RepID=A0A7Z0EH97_9MICO|nr:SRPBCC domain-containing protein [Leifsonia psychrotolerans]NYJ20894.1 uncharacterized protein YndB with AHSA1/START domain [Leifsonia psychrotolerans]